MIRALFRLVILLIVLVAVGGFFLGWWGAGAPVPDRDTVATAGQTAADAAKRAGNELGQKAGEAAKTAQEAMSDGTLTAKIKAKMALDDSVKALDLDIDTVDGVVTLTGKVKTRAERERAVALARETNGVRQVVDRLTLQ